MAKKPHRWVVLETCKGNRIVTERHADGTLHWSVNPAGFQDRYDRAVLIGSSQCQSTVRSLPDLKGLQISADKDYAEEIYMVASGTAMQQLPDAKDEAAPITSASDARSHDGMAAHFDFSFFESFDASTMQMEVLEPVDSHYKQFGGRCLLLRNALTPSECAYLIEKMGGGMERVRYRQDYRRTDRSVFESPELANLLWKRVEPFTTGLSLVVDEDHSKQRLLSEEHGDCPSELRVPGYCKEGVWHPVGLNECLRFCKYNAGDFFRKHTDACFERSEDEQSLFTCMFYLNGDFEGGATRFLRIDGERDRSIESQFKVADDHEVLVSVQPEAGHCMLFFQPGLLHEGEELQTGMKYILRTDMMCRRDAATKKCRTQAQVDALNCLQQAQAAEERKECDLACSLYRRAFKLDPDLEQALR